MSGWSFLIVQIWTTLLVAIALGFVTGWVIGRYRAQKNTIGTIRSEAEARLAELSASIRERQRGFVLHDGMSGDEPDDERPARRRYGQKSRAA